ncbi:carrier superfamily protein [Cardiosporidium cionae]|uniref:Carrier superfamily protein n=1 Tax=Cardiosporidium cionae TaxID=476202 RepID=A0ABQ7JC07_9APIC|nr:carrier superfamily protein [Cardiosporidium cionae]|eukprot:KAF8821200.1 carrier superfamily protein [Cardiosporidium cionae]
MLSSDNLPKTEAISEPPPTAAVDLDEALNWEFWKGDWPFWKHALAGSCAGVMEHIVMFPLDTVKTRVQAMKTSFLVAKNGNGPALNSVFDVSHTMSSVNASTASSSSNTSPNTSTISARPSTITLGAAKDAHATSISSFPKVSAGSLDLLGNGAKSNPLSAIANATSVNAPSSFFVSGNVQKAFPGSPSTATIPKISYWNGRNILGSHWMNRSTFSFRLSSLRPLSACFRLSPGRGELAAAVNGLVTEGGFLRFFRGVSAITCGCIPAHASYFSVYEITKFRLGMGHNGYVSPINAAVCGAAATFSHDMILTPMDMVKQRLQLGCYKGTVDCVRTVFRREGYSAFFRSMPTTILMNIPFGSVAVSVNELMKSILRVSQVSGQSVSKRKPASPSMEGRLIDGAPSQTTFEENLKRVSAASMPISALLQYFFCAGVGGGIAGVVSNPLDVIKTRLQTQDCEIQRELSLRQLGSGSSISPVATMKYTSFLSSIKIIWHEEGIVGFWKGTSARMALCIPATAVSWGTYEFVKYLLTELA